MTVPTYDKLMLPLLRFAGDGEEHHIREAVEALAVELGMNEADRSEQIGSGKFRFDDRVQWANTYLKQAGLLESKGRGRFRITGLGFDALKKHPTKIDVQFLNQYPGFVEFQARTRASKGRKPPASEHPITETPQETLDASFQALREQLVQELLEYMRAVAPPFFEKLVVEVLQKMGYGGLVENSGLVVGGPGDGGIDGIITEDKLGFDAIYIQAKRWNADKKVDGPAVREFAGGLALKGATKGVFITTSSFTPDAVRSAGVKQPKIVLVDGQHLAEYMIDYDVGVIQSKTYTIKRVDPSYFDVG